MRVARVGIIGRRGQADRHIQLLKKRADARLEWVFVPGKVDVTDLPVTQDFGKIQGCDAVIISSPTPTHAEYLDRLSQFPGYILLEKPAASTREQTEVLRRWPEERKKRTRINFNFRFSPVVDALREVVGAPGIGDPVFWDVHTSHGLAFTPKYRDSWRGRAGDSRGVLETVGVHFVNLALLLFGRAVKGEGEFLRVAGCGGPPDTAVLRLWMENGVQVMQRHSYAGPFFNRWTLVGSNGYWDYDGRTARFHSPRETFDAAGRFTDPPLVKEWRLDYAGAIRESMSRAVDDFLRVVNGSGSFDLQEFAAGLDAMEPIFAVPGV